MTTTAALSLDPDEGQVLGLPRSTWMKIGVIAGLMALVFWPNLRRLWLKTNPISGDPNWGHSVIVPIVGLYYLYVNRDELLKRGVRAIGVGAWSKGQLGLSVLAALAGVAIYLLTLAMPQLDLAGATSRLGQGLALWGILCALLNWGMGSLLFGLVVYTYGIYPGQNDYVKDLGMIITLFGVVLFLCGWGVMRVAWFPIAFLVCALPWPGLVYSKVAMPLQNLAAYVAVNVLSMTGVIAQQVGTKMLITNGQGEQLALNVAEACAGMRSLMTFISVGAAVGFLSSRPLWQKIIITASGVPIAIFCNVMRVSGQGLLHTYVSTKWSEGFAHAFAGMVMLVPGFFLILAVGWLLDKLFIEEVDDEVLAGASVEMKPASEQALVVEIPRRRVQGKDTAGQAGHGTGAGDSVKGGA